MIFWLAIAWILIYFIYSYWSQHKSFNNGFCSKCGLKLEEIENKKSIIRGNGWLCESCYHIVWIHFPFIDSKYRKRSYEIEETEEEIDIEDPSK